MKTKDQKEWDDWCANNTDPYGSAVCQYAKAWAEDMEAQMADGAVLENIAKDSSQRADTEGITGFMYGAAVSMLSHCWIHGEQLRKWHNLATQIGHEGEKANESGGILNPALLNIG